MTLCCEDHFKGGVVTQAGSVGGCSLVGSGGTVLCGGGEGGGERGERGEWGRGGGGGV